jgi:S-adenosyl-L-methionine hydrolase (adenosine-forming)
MQPIVALLTDFGTRDAYVGALKGAILSRCRSVSLVDVVHDLEPHDILAAALCLEAVFERFPPETAFVVVVDPGVGSSRRGLAARAAGRFLVGPDNGVLELVLSAASGVETREIRNAALLPGPVSRTFHGRDVFAPVAAALVSGLDLAEVGPLVVDPVRLALPRPVRLGPLLWETEVIVIDRFGNLITNLSARELTELGEGGEVCVVPASGGAPLRLVPTYSAVAPGESCALVGSTGRLEIAVAEGSAAARLGPSRGARFLVGRRSALADRAGVLLFDRP